MQYDAERRHRARVFPVAAHGLLTGMGVVWIVSLTIGVFLRQPLGAHPLEHRTEAWGGAALPPMVLDMRPRTGYGRMASGRRRSKDH